jgi:hypothetical protein
MADGGAEEPTASEARRTEVQSVLLRHVRDHPGLSFGALVRWGSAEHRYSRTTVARHLAQLVRFGDVVNRPDHTYVPAGGTGGVSRPLVEFRSVDDLVRVAPDGSVNELFEMEFRVLAGSLEHLEVPFVSPGTAPQWWCTLAAQAPSSRSTSAHDRPATFQIDFAQPLTARTRAWQRFSVSMLLELPYQMARRSSRTAGPARCSESIQIAKEARRFSRRLAPDGHFRLRILFPARYPVGRARVRVVFVTELGRTDPLEEARVKELSRDAWHQDGFRRSDSALILSVPRPLLDRRYVIDWELSTQKATDRWRTDEIRRMRLEPTHRT